ncbi:sterol desaturase [Pholiota conissans]|uniref:Sterol desaturase n=1 Tax=Pholiota conissans TaxID=109636 RepID=A0A9P5Z7B9_9AGAR|nr:sterol desaturase [Pholiota conissans]
MGLTSTFARQWATIVTTYPHPLIEFCGSLVVQVLFFWIPCSIYMSLEHIAPAFARRHKIQPAPKPATRSDILQCLQVVLRNQVVATIMQILLLGANHFSGKPSKYRIVPVLPSAFEFLSGIALSILIREVSFYYIHRIFHQPYFYARIHKTHHRFVAPMSLAAQYASIPEHIVANIMPLVLPGLLFDCHILTYWGFLASQLIDTSTVHSGYDFFARVAEMHDKHHELFNVNYGVIGLVDWVHGTNNGARKARVKGS